VELEKLREKTDTTVVVVTHDVQEALLLADHVIVMNSFGSIETRKEIKSDYSIMQRVSNISGYMNSVYENYMLPIQDAIINGQSKINEKQNTIHIA
jgi:ABC-type nitrate/sulfonate/bicarbonate transport system ATPase subunit